MQIVSLFHQIRVRRFTFALPAQYKHERRNCAATHYPRRRSVDILHLGLARFCCYRTEEHSPKSPCYLCCAGLIAVVGVVLAIALPWFCILVRPSEPKA